MDSVREFWENKRVWVVGASSGIGEGLVKWLAEYGAKIIISARREEILKDLKSKFSTSEIAILSLDAENHSELDQKANEAWKKWDGLDVVFLNAGISVRDLVMDTKVEFEKKMMDVNFWGPVILTKSLLKLKPENSPFHLVITSSLSGKYGVPKLAGYAASKHALQGYFDSLRTETATSNLSIHIVIPGFIRTNITVAGLNGDGSPNGQMQNALKEGMDPSDCARLILKGIQQGKEEFVVGGAERFTVFFNRIFPGLNRMMIRSHPLQRLKKLKGFFGMK